MFLLYELTNIWRGSNFQILLKQIRNTFVLNETEFVNVLSSLKREVVRKLTVLLIKFDVKKQKNFDVYNELVTTNSCANNSLLFIKTSC